MLILATQLCTKNWKVFSGITTQYEDSVVKLLAVVLKSLNFDVLLGLSWLDAVKAQFNIKNSIIKIGNKHVKIQL